MDTLNLSKSYDFFKPEDCTERIHIIGCGSVGSTVAELLARFGLTKLTLYDFDTVEPTDPQPIICMRSLQSSGLKKS